MARHILRLEAIDIEHSVEGFKLRGQLQLERIGVDNLRDREGADETRLKRNVAC